MPKKLPIDHIPVDETNLPRYCIFRKRKVRIIAYEGANWFRIVDTDDTVRTIHRTQIDSFVKENKK
jgi:hypothetical protein